MPLSDGNAGCVSSLRCTDRRHSHAGRHPHARWRPHALRTAESTVSHFGSSRIAHRMHAVDARWRACMVCCAHRRRTTHTRWHAHARRRPHALHAEPNEREDNAVGKHAVGKHGRFACVCGALPEASPCPGASRPSAAGARSSVSRPRPGAACTADGGGCSRRRVYGQRVCCCCCCGAPGASPSSQGASFLP